MASDVPNFMTAFHGLSTRVCFVLNLVDGAFLLIYTAICLLDLTGLDDWFVWQIVCYNESKMIFLSRYDWIPKFHTFAAQTIVIMKSVLHILSMIVLFLMPMQLSAQTKRALVIGLGEQEDKSWAKINGDKDVRYVKKMLMRANYDEIDTLVNRQATKAGIVAAFQNLTESCQKNDVILVYFSGHGQQVTDVDGDEVDDGWDESWVPYDAYAKYGERDMGEKHLIDDEVNVMLTVIRDKIGVGGKLLVVVDACYSGGSVRDPNTGEPIVVRGADDKFRIPLKDKTKPSERISDSLWLTLSACYEYQLAQELPYPKVGKLTYALSVLSEKGVVYFRDIEMFMDLIRSDELPQNPVLTGETKTNKLSDFFR